jgi:hypothetical protein
MNIPKLTREQAVIISGYTGILCCEFQHLQMEVEKRMGRSVWTHEFATGGAADQEKVAALFKRDFLAICAKEEL